MNKYFEGDYRRTPQQNLAGASKKYNVNTLITKSQSERKKREKERVVLEKTIIIQSYFRGYMCRKYWKIIYKNEFNCKLSFVKDTELINLYDLCYLIQRMGYFFPCGHRWNHSKIENCLELDETEKFVSVLNLMQKINKDIIIAMGADKFWVWRVIYMLQLSMAVYKYLPSGCGERIPTMLQTILYFTNIESYSFFLNSKDPLRIPIMIWSNLFDSGIFHCLCTVINIMYKFKDSTYNLVIYLNGQIFRNLIKLINKTSDSNFRHSALQTLGEKVMKASISLECTRRIFTNFASMEDFPLAQMGKSLIIDDMTPECVSRFLYLDDDQRAIPSADQKFYFSLLSEFLYQLFKLRHREGKDDDSDDDKNTLTDDQKLLNMTCLSVHGIGVSDPSECWILVLDSHVFSLHLLNNSSCIIRLLDDVIIRLNTARRTGLWLYYLSYLISSKDSANLLKFCKCLHLLWIAEEKPIYVYRIIKKVAFHQGFLNELFQAIKSVKRIDDFENQNKCHPLIKLLSSGVVLAKDEAESIVPALCMFCFFLKHNLSILNDELFYKEDVHDGPELVPFKLSEIKEIANILKDVAFGVISLAYPTYTGYYGEDRIERCIPTRDTTFNLVFWRTLLDQLIGLLRLIHNRDSRRQFTDDGFWLMNNVVYPAESPRNTNLLKNLDKLVPFESAGSQRSINVYEERYFATLRCLPFTIDFLKRFKLYQGQINELKLEFQNPGLHFLQSTYVLAQIRRDYIYEDALEKLNSDEVPELRIHVKVHMISSLGIEEPGIDGGGLFREFILEFLKTAFDPNRGFFLINKDNELYPNPRIDWIEENFRSHYYFIGRMLGKAMFENILVEIPLAEFFLAKLLSNDYDLSLNGLSSLDPDLYKNLMSLMNYSGDFTELGLDFTLSLDYFGTNVIVELKPDGADIPVSEDNVLEYIHLVAEYKINYQISAQTDSFLEGLTTIIPQQCLSMFSTKELQLIISGNESPIDIADLRSCAVYTGDYTNEHPTIEMFWRVVSSFTSVQKSLLLKFVTSCSRPPLLGFKELHPPFCIQFIDSDIMLPSASTCMNILKLPNFQDEQVMREKILYAISSGAGFELI